MPAGAVGERVRWRVRVEVTFAIQDALHE